MNSISGGPSVLFTTGTHIRQIEKAASWEETLKMWLCYVPQGFELV